MDILQCTIYNHIIFQSTKKNFSTDTILVKILDDILEAFEEKK